MLYIRLKVGRVVIKGIFLIIPFFLIRFGLLSFFGKRAVSRVAYFAPINKDEIPAYYVYQISTHSIIISEERWCLEKFGNEYKEYMARVGRYFLV